MVKLTMQIRREVREMDQERFDRWTRSLASGRSRRSFLQGAAASIAAGLVAFRGKEGAAAPNNGNGNGPKPGRCGQAGQPCKFNRQCCESSGLVCYDGACSCLPGEDLVNGACVPATDPCDSVNCDDGNICTDDTCSNGVCSHAAVPERECQLATGAPGLCDATATCVPVSDPCESMNCDDGNECTIDTCENGGCVYTPVPEGAPCTTGDLEPGICGPEGVCIASACNATNCVGNDDPCIETFCLNDECVTVNSDLGTICGDGLACDGSGQCIEAPCQCPTDNECVSYVCEPVSGCVGTPHTGEPCAAGSGMCTEYGTCAVQDQCISGNDVLNPYCPQECEGNSICEGCCSGMCLTVDIGGFTVDVCQPVA